MLTSAWHLRGERALHVRAPWPASASRAAARRECFRCVVQDGEMRLLPDDSLGRFAIKAQFSLLVVVARQLTALDRIATGRQLLPGPWPHPQGLARPADCTDSASPRVWQKGGPAAAPVRCTAQRLACCRAFCLRVRCCREREPRRRTQVSLAQRVSAIERLEWQPAVCPPRRDTWPGRAARRLRIRSSSSARARLLTPPSSRRCWPAGPTSSH